VESTRDFEQLLRTVTSNSYVEHRVEQNIVAEPSPGEPKRGAQSRAEPSRVGIAKPSRAERRSQPQVSWSNACPAVLRHQGTPEQRFRGTQRSIAVFSHAVPRDLDRGTWTEELGPRDLDRGAWTEGLGPRSLTEGLRPRQLGPRQLGPSNLDRAA
jgi:hypothetical protein